MPHHNISTPRSSASPTLKLIVHLGFAFTGIVTTLTGAILPLLSSRWRLDDAQAGYLLAAQNIGGLTSTLWVGELIKRLGIKRSLVVSFALMAAGLAGVNAGRFTLGLAAVFGAGLGLGIAIPAANLLIAEINTKRRAAALNVLNFIWCLGAVIGTPMISFVAQRGSLLAPLLSLSIILVLISFSLARLNFQGPEAYGASTDQPAHPELQALQKRFALFICALAFLVVGIENALSGWIASYVARLERSQNSFAAFYQAAFWASMLFGRAVAPGLLNRVSEPRLVLSGVSLAACGILLILASLKMSVVLLGVLVTGVGLSSVFPTTIAAFSQFLGAQAARKSSWLFACGSLGSSALPFLVGFMSSRFASLRIGLTIPFIAALAAVGLQINIAALIRRLSAVTK